MRGVSDRATESTAQVWHHKAGLCQKLVSRPKFIKALMFIPLRRFKNRVREMRLVDRIGVKLRFEAEAEVFLIFCATLSLERTVEIVS